MSSADPAPNIADRGWEVPLVATCGVVPMRPIGPTRCPGAGHGLRSLVELLLSDRGEPLAPVFRQGHRSLSVSARGAASY